MLVVVEDGDVECLAQPALDLEAAWRRDVLEVDAAEDRGDRDDRSHDLVHVLRREADGEGVDPAELLEEDCFALHDGERRLGAHVTESEHGRPVRDDGDGVLLDGERPDLRGILGDRRRDPRHSGRVGHRQVVARLERLARRDLELASEVHEERPVGDVLDLDSVHGGDRRDDALEVRGVTGEHGHVPDLVVAPDPHEVDGAEQAACLRDRLRERGERARPVLESHADGGAEGS